MKTSITAFNKKLLGIVEHVVLAVIAIATTIAIASEIAVMIRALQVTLADLLLLFLYLEVLAMVGVYYSSGKIPVRYPLYIGMVALARYLVLDIKAIENWRMLAITGSILMLTVAVLLVRFGHVRYPYPEDERNHAVPVEKPE